jgi:hypothetical protein
MSLRPPEPQSSGLKRSRLSPRYTHDNGFSPQKFPKRGVGPGRFSDLEGFYRYSKRTLAGAKCGMLTRQGWASSGRSPRGQATLNPDHFLPADAKHGVTCLELKSDHVCYRHMKTTQVAAAIATLPEVHGLLKHRLL